MKVEINCSCCGGNTGKVIHRRLTSVYSDQPWDLAECLQCKNIITLPVPSSVLINEIYTKTYLYPVHLLALGEKKFRSQAMARYLRNMNFLSKEKNVLEVGCMYGYLLDELRNDAKVKGIEIGAEAVSYCRDLGLDVTDISMENYLSASEEKFDMIILSHVFEHLLLPGIILEQLRERLKPGGKLVISVPNSGSICRKVFGRYWGWWQVPVHINHFRLTALREMVSGKDMKIEKARYKGGDSLMLLLNLINLFGFRSKKQEPGGIQKIIINFFTFFFRYWYYISNEELTIIVVKN